jgi:ADP-ribose pyrophosphatase
MLRQYRVALGQTIWELPAGTRGWEEPWEACAQRELREETGYSAGEFISLGEIWPIPGSSDELMRLYLVRELTPAPLPPDEDEELEVVPLPLAEAIAMCWDGRLQDAKTIVTLLRAAHLLEI